MIGKSSHSLAVLVLTFLLPLFSFGQNSATTKPLHINGKITGYSGTSITISFKNDREYIIPVKNGEFTFTKTDLTRPVIASIKGNRVFYNSLLTAPGYNLTIHANGKDELSFCKSINIDGKGSAVNNLFLSLDTVDISHFYIEPLTKIQFANRLKQERSYTDSLTKVYSGIYQDSDDKYFTFFKNVLFYNIEFKRLQILMHYILNNEENFTYTEAKAFINNNSHKNILQNISDERYLISPVYEWLMGGDFSYLFVSVKLDKKRDSLIKISYSYYLEKIGSLYKGKVKDYVYYSFINLNLISSINSYEKFKERVELTLPYINQITNLEYKNRLLDGINEKEKHLIKKKIGESAPIFTLKDSTGKEHSLMTFRGKVVLLDFWASWCSPCRQETPFLKNLYKKCKDKEVVFIGIAVRDKINNWKKALQHDNPYGIQLFDDKGITDKLYFTNAIPRYVVIDKQGNIADFQAPLPSDKDKLEKILMEELMK